MALNPPLIGGVPMGIAGEMFCVKRDGMLLETETTGRKKISCRGSVYLTTVRMSFVPDVATAEFTAVDIPLQGISEENFKQPIFGANYLTGTVAPVPGRGFTHPVKFYLYFYKGGCTTFLKYFFEIMERYKLADAAARRGFFENQRAIQTFITDLQAFVDPSDPSTVFIVQPAYAAPAPAPMPVMPSPAFAPSPVGMMPAGGGYGHPPGVVPGGMPAGSPVMMAASPSGMPMTPSYGMGGHPSMAYGGSGAAPVGMMPASTGTPAMHMAPTSGMPAGSPSGGYAGASSGPHAYPPMSTGGSAPTGAPAAYHTGAPVMMAPPTGYMTGVPLATAPPAGSTHAGYASGTSAITAAVPRFF